MLHTIGIFISLFLGVLLFTKKTKSLPDYILGVWLLCIACHLGLYISINTGVYLQMPYLLGIDKALPFIHGPFLYLYTIALIQPKQIAIKSLLHFIPTLLVYSYIFFALPDSPEKRIAVYENNGAGYETESMIILAGIFISGVVYCIMTLYNLKEHQRAINDSFSTTDAINLNWLWRLAIGLSLLWLLVIFTNDVVIFAGVTLFVIYLGYYGIKQVGVFSSVGSEMVETYPKDTLIGEAETKKPKYENSGLSKETALIGLHKLRTIMQSDKPYLNPTLSLSALADLLDTQPNYLSQIINEMEESNFYDYINKKRIEEFKQRIVQPESQNFTIIAIAYECGFNSKATFNRLFKKYEGCAPSEFISQNT